MAEEKKTAKSAEVTEKVEDMVCIELFKDDGKYKDDVFVAVNGKAYLIQRGIPVKVPKAVAEVLNNSKKQKNEASNMMEQISAEFERKTKELEAR